MQAAAAAAVTKVKVANALTKSKDDISTTDPEQQANTDSTQEDNKGFVTPLPGKTPRGSIQRESAFVLDGSQSSSTIFSKLRRPSNATYDTSVTSESDTVKLPEISTGRHTGNEVWKDEISEVDDFLMDTLKTTDSGLDVSFTEQSTEDEGDDDVDEYSAETFR